MKKVKESICFFNPEETKQFYCRFKNNNKKNININKGFFVNIKKSFKKPLSGVI